MEKKDLLLFGLADQVFALPGEAVDIVLAPQPVTPLPFVPSYVDGLVNAGDRIMPQLNLGRLLFPDAVVDDDARGELLIVSAGHAPCAVHVGCVMGRIEVDAELILPVQAADEGVSTLFTSRCEHEGNVLLVLEPALLSALLQPRELASGRQGLLGRAEEQDSDALHQDSVDCVLVRVAGERYALALADVLEICDLPAASPLPGAPELVEGMALVRDEVLLVLSTARLLRGSQSAVAARHVLVIERAQLRYGLRVDAVEGIESFSLSAGRTIEDEASQVACVFVQSGMVTGLLTPQRLLSPSREAMVHSFVPDSRQRSAATAVVMRMLLQVEMADEQYALALDSVRRVVPYQAPEAVDAAEGDLVSAIANINGTITPVLDLAVQLGLVADIRPAVWVIVEVAAREWAIPVTRASDILEIPVTAIESLEGRKNSFVAGMATVGQQLVSLLSLSPLETQAALQGEA